MNAAPDASRWITSGGAIGLRIPMTGFPHAIRSPPVVYRTPNGPSICCCPQPCGRRVDLGLDRGHLVGVDLGADRRVDQLADGLGEGFSTVRDIVSDSERECVLVGSLMG